MNYLFGTPSPVLLSEIATKSVKDYREKRSVFIETFENSLLEPIITDTIKENAEKGRTFCVISILDLIEKNCGEFKYTQCELKSELDQLSNKISSFLTKEGLGFTFQGSCLVFSIFWSDPDDEVIDNMSESSETPRQYVPPPPPPSPTIKPKVRMALKNTNIDRQEKITKLGESKLEFEKRRSARFQEELKKKLEERRSRVKTL